jgi:hypothetical protein
MGSSPMPIRTTGSTAILEGPFPSHFIPRMGKNQLVARYCGKTKVPLAKSTGVFNSALDLDIGISGELTFQLGKNLLPLL